MVAVGSKEKDEKKPPVSDQVNEYLAGTSVGGLAQMSGSGLLVFKLLWLVVFIIGLFFTVLNVVDLSRKYVSWPTKVKVSLLRNETLEFPGVTFCNLNSVKKAQILCTKYDSLSRIQTQYQRALKLFLKKNRNSTKLTRDMMETILGVITEKQYLTVCPNMTSSTTPAATTSTSKEASTGSSSTTPLTSSTPSGNARKRRRKRQATGSSDYDPGYDYGADYDPYGGGHDDYAHDPNSDYDDGYTAYEPSDDDSYGSDYPSDDNPYDGEIGPYPGSDGGSYDWYDYDYGTDYGADYGSGYGGYGNSYYGGGDGDYGGYGLDGEHEWDSDYDYDYAIADWAYQSELSDWAFLDDIKEESENDFSLLLRKSKLGDLTDISELVHFSNNEFDTFGYSIKESVLECTNDRKNCDHHDFKLTRSQKFGNCMTFNSKYKANSTVKRTRKSGSRFGLRVTLDAQASEYVGLLASEYGFRVSVHPPDVSPDPENDGFVVQPGKLTSVSVTRRQIKRLPIPYASACLTEMPGELAPYSVDRSVYTIRQCQKACLDFFLDTMCGCVDQSYDRPPARRCELFHKEDRTCRAMVMANDILDMSNPNSTACDCRPPCHEVNYLTGLSSTEWPSDSYRKLKIINFIDKHDVANKFLADVVSKSNTTNMKSDERRREEMKSKVKMNLARVHIYYESKTYEAIEESPDYPMDNLIADVGGAVGLYLGMSVVTVIEVAQLAMLLIFICCGPKKEVDQRPPKESDLYFPAGDDNWDLPHVAMA